MPYPPEGYKITTDVPVMAPHDFSEDLGGYVDIWPLNITANVPVVNGVASRKPHGWLVGWRWNLGCGFQRFQSDGRAGRRV